VKEFGAVQPAKFKCTLRPQNNRRGSV